MLNTVLVFTSTLVPCFKTRRSKEEEAYAEAAIFEGNAFYAANGGMVQGHYTSQQLSPNRGPKLPDSAHMSYPPNPSKSSGSIDEL